VELHTVESEEAAATLAADIIARHATEAIEARGRFRLAVSGGDGPAPVFRELARRPLDWGAVELYQVDERVAPDGHDDRNLGLLEEHLGPVLGRLGGFHPMPVTDDDLDAAAQRYGRLLSRSAGDPPQLDLIHLGIGPDGHTASLVPGDPVLEVTDQPVAVTGEYQGRRRMTFTYPTLDAARHRLWHVVDPDKRDAVRRLLDGDQEIPAGRVRASSTTAVMVASVVGE
jgi:6-phosphogluconolactonase